MIPFFVIKVPKVVALEHFRDSDVRKWC